jgi:copper chaperone
VIGANFLPETDMQFHIDAMTCGGCANSVTRTIQSVDPRAKVAIDLADRRVTVATIAAVADIAAALTEVGYPPRPSA